MANQLACLDLLNIMHRNIQISYRIRTRMNRPQFMNSKPNDNSNQGELRKRDSQLVTIEKERSEKGH